MNQYGTKKRYYLYRVVPSTSCIALFTYRSSYQTTNICNYTSCYSFISFHEEARRTHYNSALVVLPHVIVKYPHCCPTSLRYSTTGIYYYLSTFVQELRIDHEETFHFHVRTRNRSDSPERVDLNIFLPPLLPEIDILQQNHADGQIPHRMADSLASVATSVLYLLRESITSLLLPAIQPVCFPERPLSGSWRLLYPPCRAGR